MTQADKVVQGQPGTLVEIGVRKVDAGRVFRATDHGESHSGLAQDPDSRITERDLHHQDSVDQSLSGQLTEILKGIRLRRPQKQVIPALLRMIGSTKNVLQRTKT